MPTTPKFLQPVVIVSPYRNYFGLVTDVSTLTRRVQVLFHDDILGYLRECWFDRDWLRAA